MYIDLSQKLSHHMPVYQGDRPVEIVPSGSNDSANQTLTCSMHSGTHIDTPGHMLPGGKKITDYSVSRFIGPAVLINAEGKDTIDADLLNGMSLEKDSIVLVYTGFGERFYEKDYFTSYPAVTEAFAEKLVQAQVKMLGLDTPSPDYAPFNVHKLLFRHDILIIENLKLDQLKNQHKNITVFALPLKLETDGALARVVAHLY